MFKLLHNHIFWYENTTLVVNMITYLLEELISPGSVGRQIPAFAECNTEQPLLLAHLLI